MGNLACSEIWPGHFFSLLLNSLTCIMGTINAVLSLPKHAGRINGTVDVKRFMNPRVLPRYENLELS